MTLHDPRLVREEYANETRLAARKRAHELGEGPDAREIVFAAVKEYGPRRILEVGCGEGELAERMVRELDADVVAVDQSERMVELARARGVARVLRPGGRLLAATNGPDHLSELYELVGAAPLESRFGSTNGERLLRLHFESVDRIDAPGWLVFPDRQSAQDYVESLIRLAGRVVPVVDGPIRARRTPTIFVAEKA